jgi:hypothetical protein
MKSRVRSVFCAVFLLAFFVVAALLAAACGGAGPRQAPEKPAASRIPAHNPVDCACTLEHRTNVCVTVNGSDSLPTSLTFVRQREGGATDLLEYHPRCFGEWRGDLQRVLMLRDGAVVDSSGWFETPTVDCCHGEAKTVDFRDREETR